MNEGIPVGKVVGFPLSIDWSVLVIMWLFTWSLAATLPDAAPGHSTIAYWLAGAKGSRSIASDEHAVRVLELVRGADHRGSSLRLSGEPDVE